ncbi:plasmid pRiA4b ORF-3 family protein [Chryseobacterium suipulveris]|uniref:Plasmid pRiA4b ORF-3 family protein n=1 Tax=Chryseobacterium suipulveris TaxID=2929800 RepID=A0ABY4BMJ2_9FLAO|nr:plasmid pRiA4b ORF-3 family protein [Chryseobacterium suipulveris]UOE40416.1 plasmid pRiA4b ORF-3 family protein [Chryseobacterium suipulveris]
MVYKIRIILDTKDDIFRDVEIKGKQNLWNLHLGIKSAFSLLGEDLSLFNILDEEGVVVKTVPLEDMSDDGDGEIMSDVYIDEAFEKVGDKIHFQYGFMDLWEFFCELVEIVDEKPAVNYPITVFRFGNMPLKAPSKSGGKRSAKNSAMPLMDDDFGSFDDDFDSEGFEDEDDENYDEEEDFADDSFDDEVDDE